MSTLTNQLSDAQNQLKALTGQAQEWKQRAMDLEQARAHLQEQLERTPAPPLPRPTVKQTWTKSRAAQTALAEATARQQALCVELAAAQQAMGAHRARAEELQANQDAAAKALASARAQLTAETSHRQRLEMRLHEVENATVESTRQTQGAQERGKLWEQSIQSLQAELDETRAALQKELKVQVERENQLNLKCVGLELRLRELESAKADLTRQVQSAKEREKLWQQNIQSLETELEQSQTALQKQFKEHAFCEAEFKGKCANLQMQVQTAEESLAEVRTGLQQETGRRVAAEQKSAELTTLRRSLEEQLQQRHQAEEQLRGSCAKRKNNFAAS